MPHGAAIRVWHAMEMPSRGLLRDPDFLKLWAGQAISQVGSWITLVGVPLTAVLLLKASPLQMGILSGVSAAAILLFGLFAGAWADRLRRRPILICADLGRALILVSIPLAVMTGRLTMAHLYLVAASTAILTVFFDVSYQAYLPSLVSAGNILEGNSKMALSESVAGVAGPALTGVLIQTITAPIAILFDAVSFLVSALSVGLIRKPEPRPVPGAAPHIGREIMEGLRASWRDPILRALLLRTSTSSVFLGFGSSLYFLLGHTRVEAERHAAQHRHFRGRRQQRIWRAGRRAPGAPLRLRPQPDRRRRDHRNRRPAAAAGPWARRWYAPPFWQWRNWAIWPGRFTSINELSLRQSIAPNHLLGRINSAMHLMFRGVLPVGAFAGGALAELIGVRSAMFVGAVGFLLSNLVAGLLTRQPAA